MVMTKMQKNSMQSLLCRDSSEWHVLSRKNKSCTYFDELELYLEFKITILSNPSTKAN